jgi:hypothetical protein
MKKIQNVAKPKLLSLWIIINVKTLKIGQKNNFYCIHYFEIKFFFKKVVWGNCWIIVWRLFNIEIIFKL